MINPIQVVIFVLSSAAILLVSLRPSIRRWGFVVGLASQPFWLYSTYAHRQWGMFALSIIYLLLWAFGAWRNWRVPHVQA